MDVKQILSEWLTAHGYDGLAGDECGCPAGDLGGCDNPFDCKPAYLVKSDACKGCAYGERCMTADPERKCPMEDEQ